MTETKTMEDPSNSVDVSEVKEDEPIEMVGKLASTSPKFAHPQDTNASVNEMQYQENEAGACQEKDPGNVDYNHDSAVSFSLINNNDFAEMPEPSHTLHNGFKGDGQDAHINSDIIHSGSGFAIVECKPSFDATAQSEGHLNCAMLESSGNDMSVRLTLDAEDSMGQRSPSAATTSSDGPSSHNCFGGGDLEGENLGIVLSAVYLEYCGAHLVDSVVSFSRSSIEARGKTICGEEGPCRIHLDVNDVVKIESQWSARYETGTLNIYFILKCAAEDNVFQNTTGPQELKCVVVDSDWQEKQEAIGSLNAQYKMLWSVLLDTGSESSVLPEGGGTLPTRSYFPKFDRPFEEVIYPKGDPDAVSISKRDVDLLLPDTFVNDTIIDFYIKYLKSRLNEEERIKFHFFNSFFFRKLADMDKDPSSAFDGKAAFQRVRKWTRKVKLFEKDFIFIPVNYNYHWSLIVICYLGEVASYEDVEDRKSTRVPCILHMDSFKGNHLGLKDLIQSYLWEEWKERQKETCDDLSAKFKDLKFVPLELPQQQNMYDCGLFLLHYVERFLEEVPRDFSIYKITPSSRILQADWFPPGEASLKRTHVEKLISDLLDIRSENCSPDDGSSMHSSPGCPNITHNYDNVCDLSLKSGPSRDCHEEPVQNGQGIEITLLPSSSTRSNLCPENSGLVLKDLFEHTSASESLNDAHWHSLESKSSSLHFESHVPESEEKVEVAECFMQTEMPGPVFQRLDSISREEHAFAYSCGAFESELVHQTSQEGTDTSPVASGELINAAEPHDPDEISLLADNPFPKITLESPRGPTRSQADHTSSHSLEHLSIATAAFTSDNQLDLSVSEPTIQMDLDLSTPRAQPFTIASEHSPIGSGSELPFMMDLSTPKAQPHTIASKQFLDGSESEHPILMDHSTPQAQPNTVVSKPFLDGSESEPPILVDLSTPQAQPNTVVSKPFFHGSESEPPILVDLSTPQAQPRTIASKHFLDGLESGPPILMDLSTTQAQPHTVASKHSLNGSESETPIQMDLSILQTQPHTIASKSSPDGSEFETGIQMDLSTLQAQPHTIASKCSYGSESEPPTNMDLSIPQVQPYTIASTHPLEGSESKPPIQMDLSTLPVLPHAITSKQSPNSIDHIRPQESDEQHASKRMRMTPADGGDERDEGDAMNSTKDLNL